MRGGYPVRKVQVFKIDQSSGRSVCYWAIRTCYGECGHRHVSSQTAEACRERMTQEYLAKRYPKKKEA